MSAKDTTTATTTTATTTTTKCSENKRDASILSEWSPSTTRALASEGHDSFVVLDHVFSPSFPQELLEELEAGSMSQMRPARTASENTLLSLLLPEDSVRGDVATFVSRAKNGPRLQTLVESVVATVTHYLQSQWFSLDLHQTSVQIARFPGNGKAGYPRHCDAGAQCGDAGNGRILTALYYLNPHDWSAEEDGGCLRLYLGGNNDDHHYHDVVPYANRLVLFRSDLVEHAVLPSKRRNRTAITLWFYGTPLTKRNDHSLPTEHNGLPRPLPLVSPTAAETPATMESIREQWETTTSPPLPVECSPSLPPIFVSIPSYRDSETFPTILSLLANAQHPHRVHVAVIWQLDTQSPEEMKRWQLDSTRLLPTEWAASNYHFLLLDYRRATGPCGARHLAQTLSSSSAAAAANDNDTLLLQIDSHMRFRRLWDSYLVQQWKKCPCPTKSILTTYPPGYTLPNHISSDIRPTVLVPSHLDSHGLLRQEGRRLRQTTAANDNIPTKPLYAAGFNLGHAKSLCPYDPTLHHLFFGEEISMAVRLYTHGFDFFAPPETVLYHLWNRNQRSDTYQSDVWGGHTTTAASSQEEEEAATARVQELRQQSLNRVQEQLQGDGNGLGSQRTVQQFATALGVDWKARVMLPHAKYGGFSPHWFAATNDETTTTTTALADSPRIANCIQSFLTK